MNVSRLVNFAVAIVISGLQWTAFLSVAPYTQSVRELAAVPVADDASDGSLPVVVVTAHRRS
jgi:hypothetical protein